MNIALWTVQILLAIVFGLLGVIKAFQPLDQVAQAMTWVPDVPAAVVRFAGYSELAGALGLILPSVTRIRPMLTPLAAAGLATVVLLGAALHFSRSEAAVTPLNFVLAVLALFVAWGRVKKAPIAPREARRMAAA